MRIKVELAREVLRFVRHECTESDRTAFYETLDEVRQKPVELSEASADPNVSRYMLRYFRFGGCIAIFEFDPGKNRMVVRSCRKLPLKFIHRKE